MLASVSDALAEVIDFQEVGIVLIGNVILLMVGSMVKERVVAALHLVGALTGALVLNVVVLLVGASQFDIMARNQLLLLGVLFTVFTSAHVVGVCRVNEDGY